MGWPAACGARRTFTEPRLQEADLCVHAAVAGIEAAGFVAETGG